jgi:hypothetical protein
MSELLSLIPQDKDVQLLSQMIEIENQQS